MFSSVADAIDFLFPLREETETEFPNKDYLVSCRCCGEQCFWGKSEGKWLLYQNKECPSLHDCNVNPYLE